MSQRVLRIGLVLLLAVSIGLAWWSRDQWTTEAIVARVAGLGVWGPLAGALLSLTGATAGATVAFLLARYLAADWVEHRLGRRVHAIKAGVEREGWRFVAFVRLVPVFPFTLLNYALGLTGLSVRTFALTSWLTMAPGALAYAYLGYVGWEAISGGPAMV